MDVVVKVCVSNIFLNDLCSKGGSWRLATKCWGSGLCLWISMECAYCVRIVLILSNALLIGSFSLVSKLFIGGMYVVALELASKIMSGATIHPLVVMLLMSG